jgi:uncharacterized protein with PIN domain
MATFQFLGGLQDLLAPGYRNGPFRYRFREHQTIKDAIEALGVPHTEVDCILVNRCSVDFNHRLQTNDSIEVYPLHAPVPALPILHLTPRLPNPAQFILDVHLGKLARRLRLLGFDSLYRNDYRDDEIMQLALEQQRIILTRDRGILKHKKVLSGYLVRSDVLVKQVREVLDRYRLREMIRPWLRCMSCNGLIEKIAKSEIDDRLEHKTRLYFDVFHRCPSCHRIYWQGSHFEQIETWLRSL